MQLVSILIEGFEYCMEGNLCLQPKLDVIRQTVKLKPPPNITRSYTVVSRETNYTVAICGKVRIM